MSDEDLAERHALLHALLPNVELRRRYQQSATFHAAVDVVVNLLPRFLAFVAREGDAADAEHERRLAEIRAAMPITVRLTAEQARDLGIPAPDPPRQGETTWPPGPT